MTDWQQMTNAAQTALTLSPDELRQYLADAALSPADVERLNTLMTRLRAPAGFMQTGASEAAPVLEAGDRLSVWRVDTLIGSGGMGQVYRATRADGVYEQIVALKVLHTDAQDRRERFAEERKRLAVLEHPGISRIIDGGVTDDGRAYLAMELVDGEPIDQFADAQSLSLQSKLRLFVDLCRIVHYAHGQLVLHRDLKAANVLVDQSGQVRLIDFGIASELGGEDDQGGPLTLAYAAPEQLLGEPLSVATDVHGLGMLLHLLVTGVLPARQPNGAVQPAAVAPADLQAILDRCLQFDRAARYASASMLADDVQDFLEHRPVSAREPSGLHKLGLFLRRNPLGSALSVALVAALTGGVVSSLRYANEARAEAARATEALTLLEFQYERTEANLKAQEAYSDVLQRAFGGDEDAERLTQLMKSRWQEAMDRRADDPLRAASLSYAIGRNFYFRGDTRQALEVFDPWMTERFGPQALIDNGEEVYALILEAGDREEEAEQLLRTLVDRYETRYPNDRANLFNYAFKLARITQAPEDISHAETLVLALIETDTDPFERLFHHNQLGFLRLAKDDREGAYDAFGVTVQIFEENPNLAAYGRDIARFNLAGQELSLKRDLDAAEVLADKILNEDVALKGESLQLGRALFLKSLIQSERGRHDAAASAIEQAVPLVERYSGTGTKLHVMGECIRALTAATADQPVVATEALAAAAALTDTLAEDDERRQYVLLTQALMERTLGESADDSSEMLTTTAMQESIRKSALQYYFFRLLEER